MYAVVCFSKQKTAYELRISDWSSDVCSSDLTRRRRPSMACFPHTPVGTPRRAIRCRCFFQQPKIKSRRGRSPDLHSFNRSADGYARVSRVLAAGGRDKRAMDGARPSQDLDVLPREKRPPAARAEERRGGKEGVR